MKKNNIQIILNIILAALIITFLYLCISNYNIQSKVGQDASYEAQRTDMQILANKITDEIISEEITKDTADLDEAEVIKEQLPVQKEVDPRYIKKLQGYNVIAILQIPKISLTTDVLENYSESALYVSVTKFFGPEPNEVGNFCVTGHNYIRQNMFSNLKKLTVGDKIYLTDVSGREIEYEVYNILTVKPEETSSLSQMTNGRKEVTLITCTLDSVLRLVVKAMEV